MLARGAINQTLNPLIRYVNITINNPLGEAHQTAVFDYTYDRSILSNCSENMCAVVSFSLPLQNLPLFIFPIVPNQIHPNLSTLQVGVCHNIAQANIDAGEAIAFVGNLMPLTWVPQELGLVIPTQNATTQVTTPYYYCYSYEHFVNIVNDAVQEASLNEGSPGGVLIPKFEYDDTKHTFAWDIPTTMAGNTTQSADGWTVCWNEAFDNLVNNFNTINNGTGTYLLEDTLSALTNTVSGNIHLAQDYPTTDAFNSAQRIICLTSSIPVAADYFPGPYGTNAGLSNTEKVLVDVSLDFDNNVGAQRSTMVYSPQLYQLSDLESTLPLNRLQLKFKWADSLNNFYDIPVKAGEVVLVKLGFFNKKLPYL